MERSPTPATLAPPVPAAPQAARAALPELGWQTTMTLAAQLQAGQGAPAPLPSAVLAWPAPIRYTRRAEAGATEETAGTARPATTELAAPAELPPITGHFVP